MNLQARRILLHHEASDARVAVEIAYSPYETMRRASLNPGARKAAEVGVVRLVERAILAQAAWHDAIASDQLEQAAKLVALFYDPVDLDGPPPVPADAVRRENPFFAGYRRAAQIR